METLLEARGITMVFGRLVANDGVDFTCHKGEVVSLLGENGAGKTTLMNILYGLYRPTAGQIVFEGAPVQIKSPRHAIRLGIQMVHQHFMLVDHLTVAENVMMGDEPKKGIFFDMGRAAAEVRRLSEAYGLKIDPAAKVGDLSVGEKQRTEIIKALYHGAKLLILDEPTAVLTPQESQELFKVIKRLRADGHSVIIITHKLHETMEVADTIYVLRHGKVSGHVRKEDTDPAQLTRMMVDHELKTFERPAFAPGPVALDARGVTLQGLGGEPVLNGLDLTVREGEIYGIAGIEGNGQQELVEVLCGIERDWQGAVRVLGADIKGKSVRQVTEMGVATVHSDRQDRGLLLDFSVRTNMMLGYQYSAKLRGKAGLLNLAGAADMARDVIEKYKVSPPSTVQNVRNFSGGNQQKLMLGREFYRSPKLAIVAHPTRGVDVGVCEIIHQSILDLRQSGAAVVLITADFDELFKLSDRIGVLYEGRIVIEDEAAAFTPNRLGFYMGGGTDDAAG